MPTAKKLVAGSIIERKTPTNHFDDGKGRCRNSGVPKHSKNLPQYTHQSITTSIRNAISTAVKTSRIIDLPPWRNGDRLQPELYQYQIQFTFESCSDNTPIGLKTQSLHQVLPRDTQLNPGYRGHFPGSVIQRLKGGDWVVGLVGFEPTTKRL